MLEKAIRLALSDIEVTYWIEMKHENIKHLDVVRGAKLTEAILFCQVTFNVDEARAIDIDMMRSRVLSSLHSSCDSFA